MDSRDDNEDQDSGTWVGCLVIIVFAVIALCLLLAGWTAALAWVAATRFI